MKQTRKPIHRLLCMILAIVMVMSMLPATALAESDTTLYLKPNSNWLSDNARFAAYFFGNGETWVDMTDSDGDGIYEVAVPSGYSSVIFCRMNPGNATNSWDNMWNQTSDLTVPTDGTNCYTVADGTWDKGGGAWSTHTPAEPEPDPEPEPQPEPEPVTYTVYCINSANWNAVAAYAWSESGADTEWPGVAMTKTDETVNGFDVYSATFDVAYENVIFNNNDNGSKTDDLVFSNGQYYDVKSGAWYDSLETVPVIDPLTTDVYLVGSFNSWSTTANEFKLDAEESQTGYVSLELEAETLYEFKVVQDGTWTSCATTITDTVAGLAFSSSVNDNAKITTTIAGTYVFAFDVSGSALSVTYPKAEEPSEPNNNEVTINIYYNRADGIYETTVDGAAAVWNAYVWGDSFDGMRKDFKADANGNMVTTITVVGRETQYVNLKTRLSTDKKDWVQEESQISISLADVVSGTINVYATSACSDGNKGTLTYTTALGTDVVKDNKVTNVQLDYDNGTVAVTALKPLTDPAAELKLVKDGVEIPVTIAANGTTYTMTMPEGVELDLVTLYRYEVTFDGYPYAIGIDSVYASDKFAEEYTYTTIDNTLGAAYTDASTTFNVWAPTAEAVSVKLYATGSDAEAGAADLGTYAMTRGDKGVWSVTIEDDLNGTYYTYSVTIGDETIEAVDPYARTTGINGNRGMVVDLDSTDPEGWADDKNPNPVTSQTDAIIYELHVRDFSIDDSSGVSEDYRGKYLAFTEENTTVPGTDIATGIDYLDELGITHLHLLPVYDYGSVDETTCDTFNWGYDPQNYNTPEGSYSTNPYDGATRVNEFKQMVKSLHDHGISVVMDVVYNHVYDSSKFCFNNIVPGYFSRVDSNRSGCGNDTASEREMVRKYIVESVLYWHQEYHIDGFRFDLVGLLDAETINQIVTEVHKCCPDVIFYGEGWDMDDTNREPGTEMAKQGNASKTPGFGYFSDSMRNLLGGSNGTSLGFVSGATGCEGDVAGNFMAKPWWTNNPQQVIQYASCHDNYTLIDKIVKSTGASAINDNIKKMSNLAAAVYLTAQGVPFIHAGEEFFREKLEENGDRCENSYNASDFVNHIEWSNLETADYAANVDYYQGLIEFRKAHPALSMDNAGDIQSGVTTNTASGNVVAMFIDGSYAEDDDIFVIFNANNAAKSVSLPEGTWTINVKGTQAGTASLGTASGSVTVDAISAMVLTKADEGEDPGTEPTDIPTEGYKTMYFTNNKGWDKVYAYVWDANGALNGSWPGNAMTYLKNNDYGEAIYYVVIPNSATGLIFNNSGTAQTGDVTPGKDGTGYYLDLVDDSTGKWTVKTYQYREPITSDAIGAIDDYFLVGYINGVDYTGADYKFDEDGTVTATFSTDSYVYVVNGDNSETYMTDGYQGVVKSVTMKDTTKHTLTADKWDKLPIPGCAEVVITMVKNNDNTITLSYETTTPAFEDKSGVQDGVTLHCWNWSFDNITANMETIAELGYTAIQTSPIQPLKEATTGSGKTVGGNWWVYYQPVNFVITTDAGNALGTKDDFEEMCAEAEKYDIKVIVDVVANHLANTTGNDLSEVIPEEIRNNKNYWHDITTNITNWNDRYNMTQYCLTGLPDLNTANDDVQNMVLDFLKECVDAGADGFRFDMAKSIETPKDDATFASDFWPTVVGGIQDYAGDDLYIYGEILDDPKIAIFAYTEYMSVTDNSWGNALRSSVAGSKAELAAGYRKVADASNLVIWAESHDTFATDEASQSSAGVSEADINKTWALVAARADAMGLYLARPASTEQAIGVASATGWDNPEVKAVNEFHNAFAGQSETIGNSGNFAYVVRGNSGIVIVNTAGTTAEVELTVDMAEGTYVEQITGETFTVENGKLTGKIGDTGIAVVCGEKTLFKIDGASMTLGNSLAINFFVEPSDLEEGETYYAVITKEYADDRADVVVTVNQNDWSWSYNYNQHYVSFNGVAAKEMCDKLTVVIYNSKDEAVSEEWIDSVRDYTMRVLKKEEAKDAPNGEKLTLYVDMLNYGAASQKEFNYNTDNLANNGLTDAQKAYATKDQSVSLEDKRVKGEGYSATNLTLQSDITMNFFFLGTHIPAEHDDYYAVATFTDHYGNAETVRIEGEEFKQLTNDTDWYVPVKGVVVADCRQLVSVTVYNAEGTAVANGSDSIESYVSRNKEKKEIYMEIMKFGVSAYASFH